MKASTKIAAITSTLTTGIGALQHVDVAVVGGGLSGLSTAQDLAAAGKSFVVLEARGRVGGRVLNAEVGSVGVEEVGAEFVGPTQDHVLALAASLGLTTYQTWEEGNITLYRNGSLTRYALDSSSDGFPPMDPVASAQVKSVAEEFDQMAGQLPISVPWEHPSASQWDSQTCESFVRARVNHSDALFTLDTIFDAVLSTSTSEPSLLYWLAYISSAGNSTVPGSMSRLLSTAGGAQDSRIDGGTALLATKLAERVGLDNIRLNAPVHKISRQKDLYSIYWNDQSVTADYVVLALPPPLASRIFYDPPLPAGRDQLTQRMPMSSIGKAILIYPQPWWRERGLNGQVLSDSGVIRATFDNTPREANFGALMGFIGGNQMRDLDQLDEDRIKDLVVADFVRFFGPAAANATSFVLQRWDLDPFSRGGPVAFAPPSVLSEYGPFLRRPFENMHFAGTETADYWVGYMDGALRSGERAAREVLDKMSKSP
ncbi:hypothetical protein CDD83_7731 [Cordyceps sp. RAO-2017]|nr:hypothetical protein CDD83_7731 [Cordyceps sp. RAO-2017]